MSENFPDLSTNHNVYILGAGFSVAAGLPLINNFLLKMRESRDWLRDQSRMDEARVVDEVLKFRLEAASAAYWVNLDLENIEELFSLAAASNRSLVEKAQLAIAATLDYTRQMQGRMTETFAVRGTSRLFDGANGGHPKWATLVSKPPVGTTHSTEERGSFQIESYPLYVARLLGLFFNGRPLGENTFITFNYDTLLEEALQKLELPFDYGFGKSKVEFNEEHPSPSEFPSTPILKLHGSVNWAYRQGESCPLTIFDSYRSLRQERLTPELIPPTWKKVFENPLETVWETAIDRLRTATRVIIVGFSMPSTDLHFKYLLASGLQRNVSLQEIVFVNPDERNEIETKARAILRPAYVDSKMIRSEQCSLHIFCRAAGNYLSKIGRPPEINVQITP